MNDGYGRELSYLRVSVTDRCNLRCRYCMPEAGVPAIPHAEVLTYSEILRLVRIMAGMGVERVRLTGGEPLVRKGLTALAADIKQVPGIRFLGLTTNGLLLPQLADGLLAAGVDGLNISLDTTDPERFAVLTRRDNFAQAKAGLEKALALPFASVKVNAVLAPEALMSDWLGVVALARTLPVDVRLIEWMPMADGGVASALPADRALQAIEAAYGPLKPLKRNGRAGPASYWQAPGFAGRIGIIPAMSHNFCHTCNRLRLTATGDLKLCLFYDTGLPLKPLLRGGAGDDEIRAAIGRVVRQKPKRHRGALRTAEAGAENAGLIERPGGMYKVGG